MEMHIQVGAYIVYNASFDRMQTYFEHFYGQITSIDEKGIHVRVIVLEGVDTHRIEIFPHSYFQEGGHVDIVEKGLSEMSSKTDTHTARIISKEIIQGVLQEKIDCVQHMIDQIPNMKKKLKEMKSSFKKI